MVYLKDRDGVVPMERLYQGLDQGGGNPAPQKLKFTKIIHFFKPSQIFFHILKLLAYLVGGILLQQLPPPAAPAAVADVGASECGHGYAHGYGRGTLERCQPSATLPSTIAENILIITLSTDV